MPVQYYTYLYRDPKDNKPIYVGKGNSARAFSHCNATYRNGRPTRLANLIKKRQAEGYIVEPILNYEVDEETAFEMEKFWIDFYGREDLGKGTLFNLTDGGDGAAGAVRDKKFRSKVAKANTGKKHKTQAKDKVSEANKGRTPWNKGLKLGPSPKKGIPTGKPAWNKGMRGPQRKNAKEDDSKNQTT